MTKKLNDRVAGLSAERIMSSVGYVIALPTGKALGFFQLTGDIIMNNDKKGGMAMGYGRFAAMIATSTIVMFGLMYLNTFMLSHIEFSQTRMWMAVFMGAVMAIIMIGFMWSMYASPRANIAIVLGSVAVFAGALWLVRSQETVDDVSWMKAMIPHHSIAIMTSERAHIRDPEVRKLADGIIEAQLLEIGQMKAIIARLEANPVPAKAPELPASLRSDPQPR